MHSVSISKPRWPKWRDVEAQMNQRSSSARRNNNKKSTTILVTPPNNNKKKKQLTTKLPLVWNQKDGDESSDGGGHQDQQPAVVVVGKLPPSSAAGGRPRAGPVLAAAATGGELRFDSISHQDMMVVKTTERERRERVLRQTLANHRKRQAEIPVLPLREYKKKRVAAQEEDDIYLDDALILASEENVRLALQTNGATTTMLSLAVAKGYLRVKQTTAPPSRRRAVYDRLKARYEYNLPKGTFPSLSKIDQMMGYYSMDRRRKGPRLFLTTPKTDRRKGGKKQNDNGRNEVTKEIAIQETFRCAAADMIAQLRTGRNRTSERTPLGFADGDEDRPSDTTSPPLDFASFGTAMQEQFTGFTEQDLHCLFQRPPRISPIVPVYIFDGVLYDSPEEKINVQLEIYHTMNDFRKQSRRRRAIIDEDDDDDEEAGVIRLDDGIILRSEDDVNTRLEQRKTGPGCSRRMMSLELANMCIHIKRVARKSARQRAYDLVQTLYRPYSSGGCWFLSFCEIENKMSYHTYNPQRNGPRLFLETGTPGKLRSFRTRAKYDLRGVPGPKCGLVTKEVLIQETFRSTAADMIAKLRKDRCSSEGDYLDFNYFCQVMNEECTGFTQADLDCLFRQPSVPPWVRVVRQTVTADSSCTDGAIAHPHSNNNATDRYNSVDYDDDNISEVSNVSEGTFWYPD
jgi:hypothetical protein